MHLSIYLNAKSENGTFLNFGRSFGKTPSVCREKERLHCEPVGYTPMLKSGSGNFQTLPKEPSYIANWHVTTMDNGSGIVLKLNRVTKEPSECLTFLTDLRARLETTFDHYKVKGMKALLSQHTCVFLLHQKAGGYLEWWTAPF